MNTQSRIIWLIALVFFTSGCSGYRVTCYTRSEPHAAQDQENFETCQIETGGDVSINLIDGDIVEGTVEYISPYEIILSDADYYNQSQGFNMDQIQTIEIFTNSDSTAGAIAIVLGASLVIGGVVLYQSTESLRNGFMSN